MRLSHQIVLQSLAVVLRKEGSTEISIEICTFKVVIFYIIYSGELLYMCTLLTAFRSRAFVLRAVWSVDRVKGVVPTAVAEDELHWSWAVVEAVADWAACVNQNICLHTEMYRYCKNRVRVVLYCIAMQVAYS